MWCPHVFFFALPPPPPPPPPPHPPTPPPPHPPHPGPQASWEDLSDRMTELGFERGWGATAARIREQFRVLLEILQVRGWGSGSRLHCGRHACMRTEHSET
jgi:hypothetical protein